MRIGCLDVIQIVFVILKLCGLIDWSWIVVFIPLIISIILGIGIGIGKYIKNY